MIRCAAVALLAFAAAAQTPEPVTEWIRTNAIPLKTVEAGNGFDDLKPLREVIGDARIVALGEATHGTREFFQLKHRMLEYLVERHGFTLFSIEANMPEAYALNDYVLNGTGDPAALLKGMYFWTWNTEEVLTMIRWMREYNVDHPEQKVQFTGFDMQTPDVAADLVSRFVAKHEEKYGPEVRDAAERAVKSKRSSGGNFGVATSMLPAIESLRGHKLRFSGFIRTEGVTKPWAGLWMRIDGKPGQPALGFDNMESRPVTGTADWKEYFIELPVPQEAAGVVFGAILPGNGKAWFDTLRFELDGQPLPQPQLDLDFETTTQGFYLGGSGYSVARDTQVAHSGKGSLRMEFTGQAAEGPDPAEMSRRWQGIQQHLTEHSDEYARSGVSKMDIDWAIQNARIVVQAMNQRAGKNNRDADMAANIGWILDQNPGARIVLWAHNGHVRISATGSTEWMGAHLHRNYGKQMRVFGFAFNRGSFRAIESGKGLIEHTVGPAPPESLDAALASAGLPRFALNFGALPARGPVAEWFQAPHATRSIGALYTPALASQYFAPTIAPETYDALLFIDETTASRAVQAGSKVPVEVAEVKDDPGVREVRDGQYGVRLRIPANWRFDGATRAGRHETTLRFADDAAGERGSLYYRWHEQSRAEPVGAESLKSQVAPKVKQRREQGRTDYVIDADDCETKTIGGRPALACVGQYTDKAVKTSEYLLWVSSPRVDALFFGTAPASSFEEFRPNLEYVAQTLKLPD